MMVPAASWLKPDWKTKDHSGPPRSPHQWPVLSLIWHWGSRRNGREALCPPFGLSTCSHPQGPLPALPALLGHQPSQAPPHLPSPDASLLPTPLPLASADSLHEVSRSTTLTSRVGLQAPSAASLVSAFWEALSVLAPTEMCNASTGGPHPSPCSVWRPPPLSPPPSHHFLPPVRPHPGLPAAARFAACLRISPSMWMPWVKIQLVGLHLPLHKSSHSHLNGPLL